MRKEAPDLGTSTYTAGAHTPLEPSPAAALLGGARPSEFVAGSASPGRRSSLFIWHGSEERGEDGTVQSEVAPGAWFDTGRRMGDVEFMFTACPVGYLPSLRFAIENKGPISDSLYNCQPGRPDA